MIIFAKTRALLFILSLLTVYKAYSSAEPQTIFERQSYYVPQTTFTRIGNIVYFNEKSNDSDSSYVLWQTDGTRAGTRQVIALNESGKATKIENPSGFHVMNDALVFLTVKNKKNCISSYKPSKRIYKIYNYKDSDSININPYSDFNLIDSNRLLINKRYNPESLYLFDLSKDTVYSMLPDKADYIIIAPDSRVVVVGSNDSLSLFDCKTLKILWTDFIPNLKKYSVSPVSIGINPVSGGILLDTYDTNLTRKIIDYKDGAITGLNIPKNYRIVDLDNYIFSVLTDGYSSIIKTDDNYNILDTISNINIDGKIINNKLYYFKAGMAKTYPYFQPFVLDLYSYNLLNGQKELIVEGLLNTDLFLVKTFPDGRLIMSLYSMKFGYELFITDGTAKGSHILKDINPGPASSITYYYYLHLSDMPDSLYFFTANSLDYGYSLWVTDGTEENTKPVYNLESPPVYPINYRELYFSSDYVLACYYNCPSLILQSCNLERIQPIEKPSNYEIFDNIFCYNTPGNQSSTFYSSGMVKDRTGNLLISGIIESRNVYSALNYQKDRSFDTLSRKNNTNGFIIKYDRNGNRQFTKYIDHSMFIGSFFTCVDSSENIISLYNNNDESSRQVQKSGLVKLNPNGESVWLKEIMPSMYINLYGLQVDKQGNIYVLINSTGSSVRFDSLKIFSQVNPDIILMKISADGKLVNYRQFNELSHYVNYNMSVAGDEIYITMSEICEGGWAPCKFSSFQNRVFVLDTDLKILNKMNITGDDFNYITSITKGFNNDIIITGTYRGSLDLNGKIINSDTLDKCNVQTSYMAYYDKELKLRYVKNFNPEPYIIKSVFLNEKFHILTAGDCYKCKIDTVLYPNKNFYPEYNKFSVAIREFDYFCNELSSSFYSKDKDDNWKTMQTKIIELNGKSLVFDIYHNKIGYIRDAYCSVDNQSDNMLLFSPNLNPVVINQNPSTGNNYYIINDKDGSYFISSKDSTKESQEISSSLYDLTGRRIYDNRLMLVNGRQKLDLPGSLSPGCYVLVVNDGKTTEQLKLIK